MPRLIGDDDVEHIHMTSSVARWLVDTCVALIRHYLGREFDPATGLFSDRVRELDALEDRVPVEDYEMRHWTNGVVNLISTLAGILHHALTANGLLRLGRILPLDDDKENLDPNIGEI